MMQLKRFSALLVLLTLLTASSCTTGEKSLQVTGESLVAVGTSFASVSTSMTEGCAAKLYSVDACTKFRLFGEKFKLAYPAARTVWNAATKYEDKTMAENATKILIQLSADLAPFLALIGGGK